MKIREGLLIDTVIDTFDGFQNGPSGYVAGVDDRYVVIAPWDDSLQRHDFENPWRVALDDLMSVCLREARP